MDMETSNKITLSERYIALIITIVVAAALFLGGWTLGRRDIADRYQAEVEHLQLENAQLTQDVADWKEKADALGPVSPKTARKILFAAYPESSYLVSLEYPYSDCTKFVYTQQIDEWKIPFTEKSFIMKWNGVITAGINMAEVSISANKAGDKLIVTIPSAQVIDFKIDEDSFELLDERNSLFNPISLEDLLTLDSEIETMMKERANQNAILFTAQSNAKLLILDALRSDPSIGSFFEIEFKVK